MAPYGTDRIDVVPPPLPPASRLRLDPALGRLGILDGGWWPRSRDASVELPNLVSLLNARAGAILRLGIDARDWDDIPRRLTVGGHVVRVGRFADVSHKIIATRGPQDHILLLVIPPQASTASAKSALAMASTGQNSGTPEEILAASGIDNGIGPVPKENEHRLPIHPLHLERIDADLRAHIYLEHGYGERFGMPDVRLAPYVAGLRTRAQLIADCDVVLLPKPLPQDVAELRKGQIL